MSTTSKLDMHLRAIWLNVTSDKQSYLYLASGHASNNACLFMAQISGAEGPRPLQVRGKVNVEWCLRDCREKFAGAQHCIACSLTCQSKCPDMTNSHLATFDQRPLAHGGPNQRRWALTEHANIYCGRRDRIEYPTQMFLKSHFSAAQTYTL